MEPENDGLAAALQGFRVDDVEHRGELQRLHQTKLQKSQTQSLAERAEDEAKVQEASLSSEHDSAKDEALEAALEIFRSLSTEQKVEVLLDRAFKDPDFMGWIMEKYRQLKDAEACPWR